jgi:hypothetical protein
VITRSSVSSTQTPISITLLKTSNREQHEIITKQKASQTRWPCQLHKMLYLLATVSTVLNTQKKSPFQLKESNWKSLNAFTKNTSSSRF